MANGEDTTLIGQTPNRAFLAELDYYFMNSYDGELYVNDNLGLLMPMAKEFAQNASGVIAIKAKSGNIRIYWFRPEQPTEVAWAGNPDKPTTENANAAVLSPRRSFEKWVEIKKGYCVPWDTNDIAIALKFGDSLLGLL